MEFWIKRGPVIIAYALGVVSGLVGLYIAAIVEVAHIERLQGAYMQQLEDAASAADAKK